jgi:hypothetical protein
MTYFMTVNAAAGTSKVAPFATTEAQRSTAHAPGCRCGAGRKATPARQATPAPLASLSDDELRDRRGRFVDASNAARSLGDEKKAATAWAAAEELHRVIEARQRVAALEAAGRLSRTWRQGAR